MAKTRTPIQQRSIETKEKLESAAKYLFSEKGFHGTNAKQISHKAGVSVGSFYAYYENKKDLFMELFRKHSEERTLEIIKNISADTIKAKESVRQIIQALLDVKELSPEFHREVLALRYSDPEIDAYYEKFQKRSIEIFAEQMYRHKDRMRVDDIEAAATIVCGATEEILHRIQALETPEEQRLIAALSDMIFRYLFK